MKSIVSVIGTRPDALKLLPVHQELLARGISSYVCATFQHDTLLQQVLDLFEVIPDYSLHVMKQDQDLFHITTAVLEGMKEVIDQAKPDLILVQGDTTSSSAAALAAFYRRIPLGHIEAGLRTGDITAPYPEEANRKFIATMAHHHFAPTYLNAANLLREGVTHEHVYVTGNTIVDALHWLISKMNTGTITPSPELASKIAAAQSSGKTIALLTAHRRESFDGGLAQIFAALKEFLVEHPDVVFLYPVHPNPNVARAIARTQLEQHQQIIMTPPLAYPDLLHCLLSASWVATDSGGIQEEAMSLGKPVIILREKTERIEGVWEGIATLAGVEHQAVLAALRKTHSNHKKLPASTIYGDGRASRRIVNIIMQEHYANTTPPREADSRPPATTAAPAA